MASVGWIRVFVADGHPLYREGVTRVVRQRPELDLVGSSGEGRAALQSIRELAPDVAVLELRMPGLDGIAITQAAQRDGLPTRVLVLSASTDGPTVYDAISAGAYAYLCKDAGGKTIGDAIVSVGRGETVLSSRLQTDLVAQVRGRRHEQRTTLTSREQEILACVARGCSAPNIASELFLSPATVKTHLTNLYAKLGVSERAAAVAEAMRRGLLE
jgi:two-component system nitrate/nitrite response regulator NarL